MTANQHSGQVVTLRGIKPSDHNYVLATWSKGILDEVPFRWMSQGVWRKHHARLELLVRGSANGVVAVNKDDEDHIIGYAIYCPQVIHWIYVKKPFRGLGIGRELFSNAVNEGEPFKFSHHCKATKALASHYIAEYDPFTIWG